MKRLTLLLVALCALLFSTSVVHASSQASSTAGSSALPGVVNGTAYAGYLQVPAGFSVASIGPLYLASLGCIISAQTTSSSNSSMTLGSFVGAGAVTDTVTIGRTDTTASVQASADVQSVNILAGLIKASDVNAVASSQATSVSSSSSNNSTFIGLTVAGIPISRTPRPNTTILLPGLGKVVLNEQVGPVNRANATSISVTAIDVSVTLPNLFGLPAGTHIIIASAQTSFQRTAILAVVGASSYGLHAFSTNGSGFVDSGLLALAVISCTGGSQVNTLVSSTIPGVGTAGRMADMASGQITLSGSTANSSSTVDLVNLLHGLITANSVTVNAQAALPLHGTGSASATTTLNNAKVNGKSIPASPTRNTKIPVPGLGYVMVNEQSISTASTSAVAMVNALDLYVTTPNSLGLPVNVQIIVGHAGAVVVTH